MILFCNLKFVLPLLRLDQRPCWHRGRSALACWEQQITPPIVHQKEIHSYMWHEQYPVNIMTNLVTPSLLWISYFSLSFNAFLDSYVMKPLWKAFNHDGINTKKLPVHKHQPCQRISIPRWWDGKWQMAWMTTCVRCHWRWHAVDTEGVNDAIMKTRSSGLPNSNR